jgi:hypothetical protein
MNPELLDNYLPIRLSNSHVISALSLSFFLVAEISTIPTLPCKGVSKKPNFSCDTDNGQTD